MQLTKEVSKFLVLLFILLLTFVFAHAGDDLKTSTSVTFENISFNEGLSNLQINSICQDDLGYIWFGTARGLNRYDGFEMKQFFFLANDSNSVSDDLIWKMKNNPGHGLLMSTQSGDLDFYDIKKEKIFRLNGMGENFLNICEWNGEFFVNTWVGKLFRFDDKQMQISGVNSFPDSLQISNIFSDNKQGIFCQLFNQLGFAGLVKFNPTTGLVNRIGIFDKISVNADFLIYDIKRIGNWLWLATNKGLILYDDKNEEIFKIEGSVLDNLNDKDIRFIHEKGNNEIWIGTYTSGLFICNKELTQIQYFGVEPEVGSQSKNLLTDCFIDRDDNVWMGTFNNGVKVNYNRKRKFNTDLYLSTITKGKFITSIVHAKNGIYYLGTRESGLIEYDKKRQSHRIFSTSNSNLANNFVCALFESSTGDLWIGQPSDLQLLNKRSAQFQNLKVPLNCGEILSFAETENGNIFMGTDASGVLNFDINGNFVRSIKEMGVNIRAISYLKNNELLICSFSKGIFEYNTTTYRLNRIDASTNNKAWEQANFVSYYIDSDSILWVGNFKWGLIRLDLHYDNLKVYNMSDGLPSNDVVGIVEDKNGFLWLSTSYGLSRFDKEESFMNFSMADGIENQQFHQNSVCYDGETIYFGGNYGVSHFNPDQFISTSETSPSVILKSFFINYNQIVPNDSYNVLSQNLAFTNSVELSHKQKSFSIDYVSLDFAETDKIVYSYILDGFDKQWLEVGKTKRAVYSNLLPGDYTFKVRARKNDSEYSEATTLHIVVKQTPWLSLWAILLYLIGLIGIILVIFRLSLQAKLYRKEKEIEHVERIRENEIHDMKMKFFTNISHEFRTPLTVISGVTYLISKQLTLSGYPKELFSSLNQNVERLLRLINQLLTFRELESDTLSLNISENNIGNHIEIISNNFIHFAQLKEISLLNESAVNFNLILNYDNDKVEKILSNLLSNALKHTDQGGRILISVAKLETEDALAKYRFLKINAVEISNSGYIEISVEDTGEGIKEEFLESIFDRYKMVIENNKKDFSSSGIGLNFVKRLINIHKGDITVSSVYHEGSVFSFVLPLDKSVYEGENFIETSEPKIQRRVSLANASDNKNQSLQPAKEIRKKYKLVVVEDNVELCKLVSNTLSNFYQVFSAFDGEKGLQLIRKEHPDMVVSDVMMPGMDGLTLCQKVKNDDELSHILFILLSARSEMTDQIEGIKKGADIYIPKPFNLEYLMAVVERQFANKEKLHKIYLNGLMPNLQETEINSESMQWLTKFNAILEKQITNVDLSVETLAAEMNMGRSNFYKKFMDITSITPNSYLVKYRINKSIELLKEGKYSLSQISDLVGCRNASYFSTLFKKEKNLSPREFLKTLKK